MKDQLDALAAFNKARAAGWSAVVEVPADKIPAQFNSQILGNKLFKELTKPVAGGRIFSTSLLNVFFADDGRVFAGAVNTQKLLEAAK